MREYDSGAVSTAELYFSNENNESVTRSEEELVITHSHSLFAAVAPLAASEFKKTLGNRISGLNKDAVMGEMPSPTTEIVCEPPLYRHVYR
jgi:hypothetical protein